MPESLRLAVSAGAVLLPEGPGPARRRPAVGGGHHPPTSSSAPRPGPSATWAHDGSRRWRSCAPAREKLEETLLAWLRHWGQRAPVAAELGIHPQTVGYRVAQLRELFGDSLEEPQVRFELELVLRARRPAAPALAVAGLSGSPAGPLSRCRAGS